jgi:hypothetical protein
MRPLICVVSAAILSVASSACATQSAYYRPYPTPVASVDQRAYTHGYDEGRSAGANDARRNHRFDYSRYSDYRDADNGYRGYGDRNAYRTLYREGFVAGYNDGYRRYARTNSDPVYPARGGRYVSPAAQNGYRDGYDGGRDDARDHDRYDPIRDSRYRSGDHGYDSRYGPRDAYKQEYRSAYEQGYERGYRDSWR